MDQFKKHLKRILKVVIPILWIVCIVVSVYFAWATASDETLIYNKILGVHPSPDGHYTAYVFIRNINVTTDETYQLTILRSYEGFKDNSGNTYVSEWPFDVSWNSDNELVVKTSRVDDRYAHKPKVKIKGVYVTYLTS